MKELLRELLVLTVNTTCMEVPQIHLLFIRSGQTFPFGRPQLKANGGKLAKSKHPRCCVVKLNLVSQIELAHRPHFGQPCCAQIGQIEIAVSPCKSLKIAIESSMIF